MRDADTPEADAVIIRAENLRMGMRACPLYQVGAASFNEIAEDPSPLEPERSGYVLIVHGSYSYSVHGKNLYVVLVDRRPSPSEQEAMPAGPPGAFELALTNEYVESLAAEVYWAEETWLRRVDPDHARRPIWSALRADYKLRYREIAQGMIAAQRARR